MENAQSQASKQQQRLEKGSWKACAPGGHTSSGARSQSQASRCSTARSTQDVSALGSALVSIQLRTHDYRHSSRSAAQCRV